jgi:hypothetical protein
MQNTILLFNSCHIKGCLKIPDFPATDGKENNKKKNFKTNKETPRSTSKNILA